MCERLFKQYPMNELNPDDLIKKYFPDSVIRKKE